MRDIVSRTPFCQIRYGILCRSVRVGEGTCGAASRDENERWSSRGSGGLRASGACFVSFESLVGLKASLRLTAIFACGVQLPVWCMVYGVWPLSSHARLPSRPAALPIPPALEFNIIGRLGRSHCLLLAPGSLSYLEPQSDTE